MPIQRSEISCGVYQLSGLNRAPAEILKEVMRMYRQQAKDQRRQNGFAQIIFSDAVKYSLNFWAPVDAPCHGERFKDYILTQFPKSELVCLTSKRSPSTQNDIRTYIWNIPHVAFKKHKFYPKTRART